MFRWFWEWVDDILWCFRGPDFLPRDYGTTRRAIDPAPLPEPPPDSPVTVESWPWINPSREPEPMTGGDAAVFGSDEPPVNRVHGWGPYAIPCPEASEKVIEWEAWPKARMMIAGRIGPRYASGPKGA